MNIIQIFWQASEDGIESPSSFSMRDVGVNIINTIFNQRFVRLVLSGFVSIRDPV